MLLRRDFFGSPRYRHAQLRELISQNHKDGAPSSVCWFITPLSADVSTINPSWCTCTIAYSILLCLDWPCFIAIFDLHQVWPMPRFAGPRWRTWSNHWRSPDWDGCWCNHWGVALNCETPANWRVHGAMGTPFSNNTYLFILQKREAKDCKTTREKIGLPRMRPWLHDL